MAGASCCSRLILQLKAVFDEAASKSPSIVFIDEVDALCPNREEVFLVFFSVGKISFLV